MTVEINAGRGIAEGTIFRPTDLGGAEKYPIFVWGEGACAKNGLSNATAMAEIASYGYFVVADGTPNGTGNRTQDRSMLKAMAAPLVAYVDWAIAENGKPCSAYYQSLDTTKIAANGFSCGGLMSQAMVAGFAHHHLGRQQQRHGRREPGLLRHGPHARAVRRRGAERHRLRRRQRKAMPPSPS